MARPQISYPRVLFSESQRFRQPWLMVVLALPSLLPLVMLTLLLRRTGGNPARIPPVLWISMLLPLIAPAMFTLMRVTVTVRTDQILIRHFPLHRRIAHAEVASFEPITYHWMDFGGWGVKWDGDKTWSFTVSGDRAVRLVLHDRAKRVVIGTQRPDELAAALEEARMNRAGPDTPTAPSLAPVNG